MGRFEGLSREHESHEPIAAQLEKATEHVDSRSASAANEHISNAKALLDEAEGTPGGEKASEELGEVEPLDMEDPSEGDPEEGDPEEGDSEEGDPEDEDPEGPA